MSLPLAPPPPPPSLAAAYGQLLPGPATFATIDGDFGALLGVVRPAVEARIEALFQGRLDGIGGRYGAEVHAMIAAARNLTLRSAKRFRAALLAIGYGGVDPHAPFEAALQGGVAIELLQTYLLIQDDWMDGDLTRRGGPSVHALLGERLGGHVGAASAILSSDFTWGLAIGALAAIEAPATQVIAALRLFTRIHEDVVIGQQIDVLGRAEDVDVMHDLKTGSYTVRGPLALGATLAGAPRETLEALDRFAAPLGVAFQLRDDLLGTFGSAAVTGKPVGNDLRAGKRTAIIVEADARRDAIDDKGREALARAFGNASASDADVTAATFALDACGAHEAVRARLLRLCGEAHALAATLPLAPAARAQLAGAARALEAVTS
jgi:geranylgeranyl diphosphate synthase, type I